MSGRSARRKGSSGERELFHLLNDGLGEDLFRRNLLQTRQGGADNEDHRDVPVCIEVKRQERVQLGAWQKQLEAAAAEVNKTPVLAWRKNREPWRFLVTMTIQDFIAYLNWRMTSERTESNPAD